MCILFLFGFSEILVVERRLFSIELNAFFIMSKTENKRSRSTNFSLAETECLIEEVLKRVDVVENKRTDAITWKQKEAAWEDLAKTFNTLTAGNRCVKVLKTKYDAIKRSIKQKHNKARVEQFKTGGGPPEIIYYTPWEEKLLQVISLSVEGLSSRHDSDQVKSNATVVMPQRPIDITFIENFDEVDDMSDFIEVLPEVIGVKPEANLAMSDDNEGRSDSIVPRPESKKPRLENGEAPSAPILQGQIDTDSITWETWTPSNLKTPRNKKLKTPSGRKRTFEAPRLESSRRELIELQKLIAKKELEKIDLQLECTRKEDARKEEEHALRKKILEQELELIKLKFEKEFNN